MSSTTTEAGRYQQPRAHLAYLKLADAAEALPRRCWTPRRPKSSAPPPHWSGYPRIEVRATEAHRLTGRLRFANLPTAATLDDFDHDAQPSVDPALITDLASNRYLDTATNILLIRPPGVGKTMLAVGLARCHQPRSRGCWPVGSGPTRGVRLPPRSILADTLPLISATDLTSRDGHRGLRRGHTAPSM
jgi:hypothetical protein